MTVATIASALDFDIEKQMNCSFRPELTHEQMTLELEGLLDDFENLLSRLNCDTFDRYESILNTAYALVEKCRDNEDRLDSAAKDWAYDRWIE